MRGHELTPENTLSNPGYAIRDGVRIRVEQRICRICREAYLAQYRPPAPPPPPPPIRSIKDPDEQEIERIVRAAISAPKAKRLETIIERLSRAVNWWGDWTIEHRPKAGEGWFDFLRRTGRQAHWLEWAVCRILDDPRVQQKVLAINPEIDDPLLRREVPHHVRTSD
ncbi:MAG TPA: hypothetical protein VF092_21500 [Longimicrobium sp.]